MAVNYNIPFQTQLEYMMQELRGPESKTMDAFKSAGAITPQDYAELFEQKYMRLRCSKQQALMHLVICLRTRKLPLTILKVKVLQTHKPQALSET
jgi:hypothetical protein